ncbi:MAG: hypothetical protein Q9186_004290 [Xanthomendoza sp. 1 TL-2023]
MAESTAGSETANSDAVNASSIAAPPTTTSGPHGAGDTAVSWYDASSPPLANSQPVCYFTEEQLIHFNAEHPVPVGDWWEVGDISHYIYSSAPRADPNVPRAWQRPPEQDRFKRQTDIANPYVQYQNPLPARSTTMAGGQGSPSSAKQQSTGKKNSPKEPRKQSSLMDTEIGRESWPVVEEGVFGRGEGQGEGETKAEKDDAAVKMDNTGTLLDLGEEATGHDMDKGKGKEVEKSAFEQLLELEGFKMDTVTATTTTTVAVATTTTITETKTRSTTLSSKSSTTSSKSQLRTNGSLYMKELSLWGTRFGDPEQASEPTTKETSANPPFTTADSSNDHSHDSNMDVNAPFAPSSSSSSSSSSQPIPSTVPDPAITTFVAQKFAKETRVPFHPLGTELDLWDAQLTSSKAGPASDTETKDTDDRGYIKRFQNKTKGKGTGKGKESEAMPDERNAMVKYDPFQSLWLNAVKRFSIEEEGKDIGRWLKRSTSDNLRMMEGEGMVMVGREVLKGESEKGIVSFDELEGFLNPGMGG